MKLTSDYKPVLASFNTPGEFREIGGSQGSFYAYSFKVGLFSYRLRFERLDDDDLAKNTWNLVFELVRFEGGARELQKHLKGAYRRQVSLSEAKDMYDKIRFGSTKDLDLKQEKQVFSTVFQIIRQFIQQKDPQCIRFWVESEKKYQVYKTMVRRYMPGWRVAIDNDQEVVVCQGENQ